MYTRGDRAMIDPNIDQECIVTSIDVVSSSTSQVARKISPVACKSLARRSTRMKWHQNQIENQSRIVQNNKDQLLEPQSPKFIRAPASGRP